MSIIKKIYLFLLITGFLSCENQDVSFPDFKYTGAYFPYQYPVRTLVLGDYIYDNSNDNAHKFLISAAMGGVYMNNKNRELSIQVDESLCNHVIFESTGDTLRLMPENYYTLSSSNQIIIPVGEFSGSIEVQLHEAFFNDPLAIKLGYAIPIRLTGSADVDTILSGKPSIQNADPRVSDHWEVTPKNFTLFAVKYINPYEGNYLHRGASSVKNSGGTVIEDSLYRARYIVDNEVWNLKTTGRDQVSLQGKVYSSMVQGDLDMLLTFSENGTCTIAAAENADFSISGSGKYAKDAGEWGDKKRNAIFIDYEFSFGGYTYNASDTLVIRDRGVVMELFNPIIFRSD